MKLRRVIPTVIIAMLVTVSALAQAPAPPPTTRVVFLDLSKIFARSSAGVAVREQMERERATLQKELDGRRQELEKLREDLEKKGALLTADNRRERQEVIERKSRETARMMDDFQRELSRKEQALSQRMQQELSGVVEKVVKQRGYQVVLERRVMIYGSPDIDITDEVIRAYDQEVGTKGKK